MTKYTVHLTQEVSTAVTVEATTPEDAVLGAYDSPDLPGSMTWSACGWASVNEPGEWRPVAVTDEDGVQIRLLMTRTRGSLTSIGGVSTKPVIAQGINR
jgi:hypothetical protein